MRGDESLWLKTVRRCYGVAGWLEAGKILNSAVDFGTRFGIRRREEAA
jgi:hypothetical protein